jgi:hypothetical protein
VALAAEVDLAFQKLRDKGIVKVEVLNFTDEENLRKQADDAFNWFKTELLKDFFKTSLEPPSFMRQNGGPGLLGQLQGLLGSLGGVQSGPPQPQLGAPTEANGTPAPPPMNLASGLSSSRQTNAPVSGSTGANRPAGNGASPGLSPFQLGFTLKFIHQDELKTREFDYSMQAAVARDAAPQGLFTTMVAGLDLNRAITHVKLDDDFLARLIARINLTDNFASAGIADVTVNLEYPGERRPTEEPTHVDGFLFTADNHPQRTFTNFLNDKKNRSYRYQLDVHFKPDSPWVGKDTHVQTPWIVTRQTDLTIDPLDLIDLMVVDVSWGSIDAARIKQAQVELLYQDPVDHFETRRTFVLKPDATNARWQLRIANEATRAYQYRISYFFVDGLRYTTEWTTTTDPGLVVNEPFRGSLDLRLMPLFDPDEIVEAVLDVTYHEPDSGYTSKLQRVFAPGSMDRQALTIRTLADQPAGYSYKLTVVRTDGSVFDPQRVDAPAANSVIVLSDGQGAIHRIRVKLIPPDLAGHGIAALKVDLVGSGDSPDRDSILFTPTQVEDKVVSLVQPNGATPFSYQYEVLGYNTQGVLVPGDRNQSTTSTLIIHAPTG